MPYDLHLEKNDFSMENDQFVKGEELSDEKFTNGLTQEIKLGRQELSYDFILGEYNLEWQKYANESMGKKDPPISMFLFKDKGYEELWMSNQIFIHSYVFETKHLNWLFGSHDLKVFSKLLVKMPLDSMFLFKDKMYDVIFGDDDLKWQGNANKSIGLLFKDKTYEKLWMSNQIPNNVFEIKHPC
jgi:hypothetical protein